MKLKLTWWEVVLAGYMFTFGVAITLCYIFIVAYFSGTFTTLVHVNAFGEAHVELISLCLTMVLSLVGFFGLFKLRRLE